MVGSPAISELVSIEAQQEVLRQATALRDKQDARLVRHQQRAAVLAGGFPPLGALVLAVMSSPAVNATTSEVTTAALITLGFAITIGACWTSVHSAPLEWHEGPDINDLRRFPDRPDGHPALLDYLIDIQVDHYERNERVIRRVLIWVGLQALLAFAALCLLGGALLAIE